MIVIENDIVCFLLELQYNKKKYHDMNFNEYIKIQESQFRPVPNLINENNYRNRNLCNPRSERNSIELSGFYIKLKSDLSNSANNLVFCPVWLIESGGMIIEEIGQGFIIDNFNISNTTIDSVVGDLITIGPSTYHFNHNLFQFNDLAIRNNMEAKPFMNAFVSRHDLLLISNGSTHIGICGATVQTGNIASYTYTLQENTSAVKINNEEYFTYRIIGFVEQSIIDGRKALVKKNITLKSDGSTTMTPGTPAETWAVPCPPRWKPT